MSPRSRAIVLLALAAVLGTLAASDVSRREAALRRGLGPQVAVVVARGPLAAGTVLTPSRLAVRRVPARFAPARVFHAGRQVRGLRTAVAVPAGADLQPEMVRVGTGAPALAGPPLAPGQRVVPVVAAGSAREIAVGSHVDVIVTRDRPDGAATAPPVTISDVEVLAVAPARGDSIGPQVDVELRVSLRQALLLTAAQSASSDIRLLVRP